MYKRQEYGSFIVGRRGIPYEKKNVNIISVAIDAPQDIISALSGRIGRLDGIGAVSYTHLDVYKRQDEGMRMQSRLLDIFSGAGMRDIRWQAHPS